MQGIRGRARWSGAGDSSLDDLGDATEREVSARLGFKKHDIVWADLGKGVHWPALVLNIRNRGLQVGNPAVVRIKKKRTDHK